MPTVIIPPTDVSPNTGSGSEVLATDPVFPSNITLSGTTSTITLGSTNTGSIAVDSNGGLTVTGAASGASAKVTHQAAGASSVVLTGRVASGNVPVATLGGTTNGLVITDNANYTNTLALNTSLQGNLTVSGTGTSSVSGRLQTGVGVANSAFQLLNSTSGSGASDGLALELTGANAYFTNYENGPMYWFGGAAGANQLMSLSAAGNLTVSGTTGVTATDLTLGSSGPSVKSTLSARAPRQGLVFDGAGSGFATMGSSLGTSSGTIDIVLDIPSSNPSTARGVFTVGPSTSSANFGNTLSSELRTDGKLWVTLTGATTSDYRRVESSSSLVSLFGGKKIRLTVVRNSSASTLTIYTNGILLATAETTGGTAPAWSGSVTGTYFIDGGVSPSENYVGYHSLSGFYNRALSASEVVALYEAGAPAGADYGAAAKPASNTNMLTTAQSQMDSGWTAVGTATLSGGQGILGTTANDALLIDGFLTAAKKYRVTLTIVSGSTVKMGWAFAVDPTVGTTPGTYTIEVETRAVGGIPTRLGFYSTGNAVIDNVSVFPIGLLLAPDAAQAGGGLTWYDTSGNAANITLPASGVSWNVPTSGYVTSGSSLNLSAGGTNQNITLTPSGTGLISLSKTDATVGSKTVVAKFARTGGSNGTGTAREAGFVFSDSDNETLTAGITGTRTSPNNDYNGQLRFYVSNAGVGPATSFTSGLAVAAVLTKNLNLLLGGLTVEGTGVLQLPAATTAAGGIGFGTDTSLFRSAANTLKAGSGSSFLLLAPDSATGNFQVYRSGADAILRLTKESVADWDFFAGTDLVIKRNNTTALTLDSSQNATFAKNIVVSGSAVANPNIASFRSNYTSGASAPYISLFGFQDETTGARIVGDTNGSADVGVGLKIQTRTNAGVLQDVLTFPKNTNNATFAGNVTVGGANGNLTIKGTGGTASNLNADNNLNINVNSSGSAKTIAISTAGSVTLPSGAALQLGNAYTAGAPTATGYVTIQDSAGNTYKVLVGT